MQEPDSKKMISRRDFLRETGAVAAGAAIPSFLEFATNEPRAHAVKVREGMGWDEGFSELREEVFTNQLGEVSAWFVEKEQNKWRFPQDMGAFGGNPGDENRDDAFAQELANEHPRRVRRGHTHPVVSFIRQNLLAPDYPEKLQRKEVLAALGPPSFMKDIGSHLWMARRFFKPADVPFEDIVFDPSGVWTITMREGTFSRGCYDYLVFLHKKLPRAFARLRLSADQQLQLLRAISAFDDTAVRGFGDDELSSLHEEYKNVHAVFWRNHLVAKRRYEGKESELYQMSSRVSPEERQTMIAEMIETAEGIDINLSFEPYATPYAG